MARERDLLRREVSVHALQTRALLGVPLDDAVSVYESIRSLGLWLMFQPLDGILGMYQRQDHAAGVAINVRVPPALQRYTAAHELGHHVLGHEASADREAQISGWSSLPSDELGAQMFAAEFLMPLAAVNAAARMLGLRRNHVDAVDVYQLSLRLRASYSAMVHRLQEIEWIRFTDAQQLLDVTPKAVKRRLLGHEPQDSRADVWLVTNGEPQSPLAPTVGDELLFVDHENPSTGYRWRADLADGLQLEHDDFVEDALTDETPVGSSGVRRLEISVASPTISRATFQLSRAWEAGPAQAKVDVVVESNPKPERGLDLAQQEALLDLPVANG